MQKNCMKKFCLQKIKILKSITIEDIKKHRFYLIGKEEFNKKNPELVEEVEKKYEKINIIFDKDKIINKTIELENKIISYSINIKGKNKKIINIKTINNINKRGKNIKSVNKNNIRTNENKTISLINKNNRRKKLYNEAKLLEKIKKKIKINLIKPEIFKKKRDNIGAFITVEPNPFEKGIVQEIEEIPISRRETEKKNEEENAEGSINQENKEQKEEEKPQNEVENKEESQQSPENKEENQEQNQEEKKEGEGENKEISKKLCFPSDFIPFMSISSSFIF